MSAFDAYLGEEPANVEIDCYTSAYRVSGQTATRFTRVSDIVNLLSSTHLVITHATMSEYGAPSATLGAAQVLVSLDDILFVVSHSADGGSRPEMRIPKRAVLAQLALPPFRLTGSVHVPQGSRPGDGLLNVGDRFVSMTDVRITCAVHDGLDRRVSALAVQRRLAHAFLVADDEHPEQLLADVLDEATAQKWFRRRDRRAVVVARPAAAGELAEAEPEPAGTTVGQQLEDLRAIVGARAPHLVSRIDALESRDLGEMERDALRSVVADELMAVGLDEKDEPTERGRELVGLIDLIERG
jgi:hypothetical protein